MPGRLPPAAPAAVMEDGRRLSHLSHLSHLIPLNPGESRFKFMFCACRGPPTITITQIRKVKRSGW